MNDHMIDSSILARLSKLEVIAVCHEANAVHLIDALKSTKAIDDYHKANAAKLEQRIAILEASLKAQAESNRKDIECLLQTIETQRRQTVMLLEQMLIAIGARAEAAASPLYSPHAAFAPVVPPNGYDMPAAHSRCPPPLPSQSAQRGALQPHRQQAPQSAPISATSSPACMPGTFEGATQRSISTLLPHGNDLVNHSFAEMLPGRFKRRSHWQQERQTTSVHPHDCQLRPPAIAAVATSANSSMSAGAAGVCTCGGGAGSSNSEVQEQPWEAVEFSVEGMLDGFDQSGSSMINSMHEGRSIRRRSRGTEGESESAPPALYADS